MCQQHLALKDKVEISKVISLKHLNIMGEARITFHKDAVFM